MIVVEPSPLVSRDNDGGEYCSKTVAPFDSNVVKKNGGQKPGLSPLETATCYLSRSECAPDKIRCIFPWAVHKSSRYPRIPLAFRVGSALGWTWRVLAKTTLAVFVWRMA
jgi:hypothetical protein